MTSLVLTAALQAALLVAPGKDYAEAYQQSLKTGRPLVVLLGADWCPACLTMKNTILPQVNQQGGLKGVELAYVDVDREPELAQQLSRARSIPQLIRFEKKPTGWVSQLLLGSQSPEHVAAFVRGEFPKPNLDDPNVVPVSHQPPAVLGALPAPVAMPVSQ